MAKHGQAWSHDEMVQMEWTRQEMMQNKVQYFVTARTSGSDFLRHCGTVAEGSCVGTGTVLFRVRL